MNATAPDCLCLVTWHVGPGLAIPLRGMRGVAARRAAEAALAALLPNMAPRASLAMLEVIERDAEGRIVSRMVRTASAKTWSTPKPPKPCARCGGHGWESVMDSHCYACGREGPRSAAYHARKEA